MTSASGQLGATLGLIIRSANHLRLFGGDARHRVSRTVKVWGGGTCTGSGSKGKQRGMGENMLERPALYWFSR